MRLRYAPRAANDLVAIADYLTERSPSAARAVEARILSAAQLLKEFPHTGHTLEQRPSVRVMPVGRYPYLLFYSVSVDEVIILHVRHGARKPPDADEF